MQEVIRVAVDAMGGDNAPGRDRQRRRGGSKYAQTDLKVILVGQEEAVAAGTCKSISMMLDQNGSCQCNRGHRDWLNRRFSAIRSKKDSSIVVGMKLVKNGEADAFVSAGSTGAVLVGGQVIVGRIKGSGASAAWRLLFRPRQEFHCSLTVVPM